ncbi:MAG: tetratricopeptide repeat protein [Gaiellales bacterium]
MKPVKRGSRVVSRTEAVEPAAPRETKAKTSENWEDQLFFSRLRHHMKWVFALLALLFAVGFVVFGVGTGTGGVGDFLGDLFGSNDGAEIESVEEAQQRVEENPQDPEALLALVAAYRSTRQPKLQAETLERYLELRPDDADAVSQLGRAYFTAAQDKVTEASAVGAQYATPITSELCTFPDTSGLVGAICDDPIDQALSNAVGQQAADLYTQADGLFAQSVKAFDRLTVLRPDDPTSWLFLGNAARSAGDPEAQLAAFKEFLTRFPSDPNRDEIQKIVDQLENSDDQVVG